MTITARYMTRRGAGVCRTVNSAAEVEKILKGGYSALSVTIETDTGELVGKRWREPGERKWLWFYDQDFFK